MAYQRVPLPPQYQTDAVLTQANPVSGTKYTVLDTTLNARIITIAAKVTWTVQPTPLEVHITIDGVSISPSQTDPVSTTVYSVAPMYPIDATYYFTTTTADVMRKPYLFEGRSVKIEAEITGGTVSELKCRVKYAKW